jgi:hypothetical protein
MRLRDLARTAAFLGAAAVFLLMGAYGGEPALGLLCASLMTSALASRTGVSLAMHRAALLARLEQWWLPRTWWNRASLVLGSTLALVATVLVAAGRSSALVSTLISLYVGLWLAGTVAATLRRTLPGPQRLS